MPTAYMRSVLEIVENLGDDPVEQWDTDRLGSQKFSDDGLIYDVSKQTLVGVVEDRALTIPEDAIALFVWCPEGVGIRLAADETALTVRSLQLGSPDAATPIGIGDTLLLSNPGGDGTTIRPIVVVVTVP